MMKRKFCRDTAFFAILTLAGIFPGWADAGETNSLRSVTVPSISAPLTIDGRMSESAWRRSDALTLVDNQTGGKPSHRTRVRLLHDRDHLYAGFFCYDNEIIGTLKTRDDNLWKEEVIEIFLDPAGTGREYLEIEVNPIGTLYDGWIEFQANIDFDKAKSFDVEGIRIGVYRGPGGWGCEVAIPKKSLPATIGESARINLARVDKVKGKHHYSSWSPTYRWFHVPEKFGRMKLR